jgi:hypothetical protein
VATPTSKKLGREAFSQHADARRIANLVVGAVEKQLAKLPKEERMAKRESLISSLIALV